MAKNNHPRVTEKPRPSYAHYFENWMSECKDWHGEKQSLLVQTNKEALHSKKLCHLMKIEGSVPTYVIKYVESIYTIFKVI